MSKEELDKELSEPGIVDFSDSGLLHEEPFVQIGADLLFIGGSTLFEKTLLPKETLRKMVKYMMLRDNYAYIFHILEDTTGLKYLSEPEKSEVVQNLINQIKSYNISDMGFEFWQYNGKHLSEKDMSKIVDNIVIPKMVTVRDGLSFLQNTGHFLSETNMSKNC